MISGRQNVEGTSDEFLQSLLQFSREQLGPNIGILEVPWHPDQRG